MSLGPFSTGLKSWPALVRKRHLDLKRAVGIKLFGAVIKDSPVDTGRLRSNWQTSIGSVDHTTSDSGGTLATAIGTMTQGCLDLKDPYKALFLANSLPYTHRIEYDGWSHTKSPQGMVNKNVIRFNNILRTQNNLLKKGGAL